MKKPITRHDGRDARFYEVEGQMLPSVTTILSALAKPALIAWSANVERAACVEAAADLFADWSAAIVPPQMPRAAYVATLAARIGPTKASQKQLTAAGDIGSATHKMIEWSLRQQLFADAGPEPVIPDQSLWGYMAWQDFARSVSLKPLLTERTVYSLTHGYAGTLDLLARVNGVVTTIELKTSKAIYPEAFLQACAYKVAMEEMGYAPQAALIVRLPKLLTDPAFEVVTVPPVAELFATFVALKAVWTWNYANEQAYRARTKTVKVA